MIDAALQQFKQEHSAGGMLRKGHLSMSSFNALALLIQSKRCKTILAFHFLSLFFHHTYQLNIHCVHYLFSISHTSIHNIAKQSTIYNTLISTSNYLVIANSKALILEHEHATRVRPHHPRPPHIHHPWKSIFPPHPKFHHGMHQHHRLLPGNPIPSHQLLRPNLHVARGDGTGNPRRPYGCIPHHLGPGDLVL